MTTTKFKVRAMMFAAILVLGACQTDSPGAEESPDAVASPSLTGSPADTVEMETCTNTTSGYSIDYPENWTISTGEFACRWADPEPFVVAPGTEGPSTAIMVFVGPEPFDTVVNGTFDELFYQTRLREDTTINDRRAIRFEVAATGEGLGETGTLSYGYIIEKDGRALMISTEQVGDDPRYEQDKAALEEAVKTLKFLEPQEG